MNRENGMALGRTLVLAFLFGALLLLSVEVGVRPALATDTDGDGLSDALEQALGTDPGSSDSDSDNLDDFDEVFVYGTDPSNPDTDGDARQDDTDPDPLDDGASAGGQGSPTRTFSSNLAHAALSGTTPREGYHVNALTGELDLALASIDFGPGYRDRYVMSLFYLSGVTHDGPWGRNVVCNWDWWVDEQVSGDVYVYMFGRRFSIDEDSGSYTSPAGFPYVVDKDSLPGGRVHGDRDPRREDVDL